MKVCLTFDYELFFGEETGTVEKCMIIPTQKLLTISEKYKIPMTFFVDICFLQKLDESRRKFPLLQVDWEAILKQIECMKKAHCPIELHIHPHWENSFFDGEKWNCVTRNSYKLNDFETEHATQIVRSAILFMETTLGTKPKAFRAGGWCVEPFTLLKSIFEEKEIWIESSVMPGCEYAGGNYNYDFRSIPLFSSAYRFENSTIKIDPIGKFIEIPISSAYYSPLFSWMNYITGRLWPKKHKPIGDGNFMKQPGKKWHSLTHFILNHVSIDGYYSKKLEANFQKFSKKKVSHFVVIAHPKGLTAFSFLNLEKFILKQKKNDTFTALNDTN